MTVKDILERPAVEKQMQSWDSGFNEPLLLLCECYMFLLKILPDSIFERFGGVEYQGDLEKGYPILSQWIGSEFRSIEVMSGKAPWPLIDDYRRLMFTRNNGYTAHFLETQPQELAWQSDSLGWALYYGLLIYAETKIKQNSVCIPEGNKSLLLFRALQAMDLKEPPWTIDARLYIVCTLLNCGVNPNENLGEERKNSSAWSKWLGALHVYNSNYSKIHLDNTGWKNTFGREDWLALIDTLLEYGADPNITILSHDLGPYNMTAIEVFRNLFRPDQVEILMRRIREPQKASEPRSQANQEQRLEISSNSTNYC